MRDVSPELIWNRLNWTWAGRRSAVLWALLFLADCKYGSKVYSRLYFDYLTSKINDVLTNLSFSKWTASRQCEVIFCTYMALCGSGVTRALAYQALPFFLRVTLKTGSGLGTRLAYPH